MTASTRPPWGWYHQGRAAKILDVPRPAVAELVELGVLRGVRIADGNGGLVWACNGADVDGLRPVVAGVGCSGCGRRVHWLDEDTDGEPVVACIKPC